MILIADSGSTKTDWALQSASGSWERFHTQGINPFHQDRAVIAGILRQELLSKLNPDEVSCVYFYGSGVRPELESVMTTLLQEAFPQAGQVEAHSDLLGAARGLCGHNYGIASILGTGANSCLYSGKAIIQNTPALGYILGDEGSGGVLGKHFLHELYKGVLSDCGQQFPRFLPIQHPSLWSDCHARLVCRQHRLAFSRPAGRGCRGRGFPPRQDPPVAHRGFDRIS